MHSIMVISGGLAVFAVLMAATWWGCQKSPAKMITSAKVFIGLWFIAAAINMTVGVVHAGFTVAQEIPFFILVFGVPSVIAVITVWLFKRR